MPSDIQEQIERRRERARAEILKIANKGNHPVFSLLGQACLFTSTVYPTIFKTLQDANPFQTESELPTCQYE